MKKILYGFIVVLAIGSEATVFCGNNEHKLKLPSPYKKPILSDDRIIGYSMGIRPCRTSGIRLESELFKDKIIIHNYGHGGSGITLSWGSAQRVLEILDDELVKTRSAIDQPIAIIGAGVIGLSVAHELLDKGYKVSIYAKDFPPNVTASIGSGVIRSVGLGEGEDQGLLKKIHDISLERFKKYASEKNPDFNGVKYVADFKMIPGQSAIEDKTLVVQAAEYLGDLLEKAKQKGVQLVHKTFATKDDIVQLLEPIIINCTGYGARDLFEDQDVFPVRGHTILLAPQEGVNYNIEENSTEKGEIFASLTSHNDRIVVGGSYEKGVDSVNLDEDLCKKILDQARLLLDQIEFEE